VDVWGVFCEVQTEILNSVQASVGLYIDKYCT